MFVKTFRDKSLKGALNAAKAELGPDALVLSTAVVQASGVRGLMGGQLVEVTAAVERRTLSDRRRAVSPERTADAASDEIAARLTASGLEPALARAIAAAQPEGRRRNASAEHLEDTVAAHIAALVAPDEDLAPVEVFVGPPGAGKTTTIAKIAAHARASQGRRLGLVAADGYRVGAVEQLRLFANILGAPLAVARTAAELERAVASVKGPVLLDTPGRSPNDDAARDIFASAARVRGARTHLVLPASIPASLARRTLERFADARPARIVVTKLDEVESLAPLVGVLQESGLPISFLGTGQRVPEDLHRATPAALASWVLGTQTAGATA
jgi:flagellar biosynthesis protein FlhF